MVQFIILKSTSKNSTFMDFIYNFFIIYTLKCHIDKIFSQNTLECCLVLAIKITFYSTIILLYGFNLSAILDLSN